MEYSRHVRPAHEITAYTGGVVDAHMVAVMMTSGQRKIHMIKHIQMNRQGHYGATGISTESRHIGAEEEYSTRNIIARNSSNTRILP